LLLVYEEAHNYIPREQRARSFARKAVERVAKEGRKYGVSGMIISQRPSELSETVLAQCNSMLILRLNNPDDQEYVSRVVSDQFSSLVSMLPVLRPGEGFIIGDAVLMPLRTLIELPRQLPQSGDVDYFKHWSLDEPSKDIESVVRQWWCQNRSRPNGLQPRIDDSDGRVVAQKSAPVAEDAEDAKGDSAKHKTVLNVPRPRQVIR
jgi:hypothetical protein